jgi:hypothetical protein
VSTCISSHGEYDAHETDPSTYVCKWCHEFDETGALAEIARLRRGPVTGMEHATEQADNVRELVANALLWSSPTNHAPSVAALPLHRQEQWRIRADAVLKALAEAGFLAPAPLREEWAAIDDDGDVRMRYGADSHSPHREFGTSWTYSRWVSDWKPYEAEGDGRADQ